ncbi:MAG: CHAP domain-containing protein [Streptococcaceae bacterium]|nr:CHAP domain-containing protein [Streptococcaceae bacterium]
MLSGCSSSKNAQGTSTTTQSTKTQQTTNESSSKTIIMQLLVEWINNEFLKGKQMKKNKIRKKLIIGGAIALLNVTIGISKASIKVIAQAIGSPMHRIYNPNSGEHFYTRDDNEKNVLVKLGWKYEGIGWFAPNNGKPVHRLYNPNSGGHHYTTNTFERDSLVKIGWRYEGVGWFSGGSRPLLRAYNPNAKVGTHNYTVNTFEQQFLINAGWRDEGIGWYSVTPFEMLDRNLGQTIYNGECYGLVSYYVDGFSTNLHIGAGSPFGITQTTGGNTVNAWNIGRAYHWELNGFRVMFSPKYSDIRAGDIINFGQGGLATSTYGHTAIIASVDGNNRFTTYE